MFCPEGYTPISEVAFKSSQKTGFSDENLFNIMNDKPIFFVDFENKVQRVNAIILTQVNGSYAFINDRSWVIEVSVLFNSGTYSISQEYIPTPLGPNPSQERTNVYRRTEISGQILTLLESDPNNLNQIPPPIVFDFDEKNGQPLCLRDADASDVIQQIEALNELPIDPIKHASRKALESAFLAYVDEHNGYDGPTKLEKKLWRENNSITKDRMRELCVELAPDHWSKAGVKTNKKPN